jgi:hypothetical protein
MPRPGKTLYYPSSADLRSPEGIERSLRLLVDSLYTVARDSIRSKASPATSPAPNASTGSSSTLPAAPIVSQTVITGDIDTQLSVIKTALQTGGAQELDVTNLKGRLSEPQTVVVEESSTPPATTRVIKGTLAYHDYKLLRYDPNYGYHGLGRSDFRRSQHQIISRPGTTSIDQIGGPAATEYFSSQTAHANYIKYTTAATANDTAGISVTGSHRVGTASNQADVLVFHAGIAIDPDTTVSNVRYWVGLYTHLGAAPAWGLFGVDNPTGEHVAAFRLSTGASDTEWKCVTGDGANINVLGSGVAVPASSQEVYYDLEIHWKPSTVTFFINGQMAARSSVYLPGANMGYECRVEALTNSARSMLIRNIALEF